MNTQEIKNRISELENKPYNKNAVKIFLESVYSCVETKYPALVEYIGVDVFNAYKEKSLATCDVCYNYPQAIVLVDDLVRRIGVLTNNAEPGLKTEAAKLFETSQEGFESDVLFAKQVQIIPGCMPIEQNTQTAMQALYKFSTILNQAGIEYTVVGALPCYLKGAGELIRYHDDIDILIQDKDIDKLKAVIESYGEAEYQIVDNRQQSKAILVDFNADGSPIVKNGGNHEVYLQHSTSEFHVGFFLYDKYDDRYETKRYYTDEKTGAVVALVEHSILKETWDRENCDMLSLMCDNGESVMIPCCTIQSVYDKKFYIQDYNGNARPKDVFDKQMFESFALPLNNYNDDDDCYDE